ncbi:HlyC/CorC family transporter [Nakamurella flavida]|uniref:HlyC/CorC family transporter n=1 Tax=Nakamurella flavida TaxID=363630 RepID=A0A939C1E4_9ACTN|nr:hemolysin family protein [Nakamurella flavida]MBM9475380.1 HlyC/CorC family transporter [Nakamurella flavida]MDP9776960.1 CBS domain containing-hemolysin-like protein [Nakamurella flavida]
MITQWVLLVVGFILIAGTALYVSAEFSLVTVDRATVARQAASGDRGAKSLMTGLRSLSTQLSGAQVGITVTTLALGFVMEPSLAQLLSGPLGALGLDEGVASSVSVIIALVVATVLSMVLGELVPKNIAIAEPLETAKQVITPMRVSTTLFRPLIWVLNGIANGVLRVIGIEPQEELRSARSSVELHSLVRRSAARGTLEAPTAGLLARSIAFSGKTAADVLTPRPRVRFVKASDPAGEIVAAAVETGHSRFPVSGEDSDDVVGLVHLKRAVAIPPDDRDGVSVRQLMVPVPVVPESIPLDDLLDQLREFGLQMAVVADEYGGTAGILTLEDVVEELVGEITDEHDPTAVRGERRSDGTWALPGTLRPDEIEELTGVSLPESGAYETVAGLLIARLGRMPQNGDTVEVSATMGAEARLGALAGQADDEPVPAEPEEDLPRAVTVRLTVHRLARRRIETVQLSAVQRDDPAEDGQRLQDESSAR